MIAKKYGLLWAVIMIFSIFFVRPVLAICTNTGDPCDDGNDCTVEDHCVCAPPPAGSPPPGEAPVEEAPENYEEEEVLEEFHEYSPECVCIGNPSPDCVAPGEEPPPSLHPEEIFPPSPSEVEGGSGNTPGGPVPTEEPSPPENFPPQGSPSLGEEPAPIPNPSPIQPGEAAMNPFLKSPPVTAIEKPEEEWRPLFFCFSASKEAIDLTTCNVSTLFDKCTETNLEDSMVPMSKAIEEAWETFKGTVSRNSCANLRRKVARYIQGLPTDETPTILKLTLPKREDDEAIYSKMEKGKVPALSTCIKTGDLKLNNREASLKIEGLSVSERPALVIGRPGFFSGCSLNSLK
jgi:hypothetical protein